MQSTKPNVVTHLLSFVLNGQYDHFGLLHIDIQSVSRQSQGIGPKTHELLSQTAARLWRLGRSLQTKWSRPLA
jgi:hypothetical protein